MARLEIHDDHLHLALSGRERLAALHGDVTAPLTAVRAAPATERPYGELRGIRAPGAGFPRVLAIGTWRGRRTKDFAVLHGRGPGVVVDLERAEFDRLVVSADDAPAVAERIERAAA